MRIHLCNICSVNMKVPADLCVSCAYESERKQRQALEEHLNELLALSEGFTRQLRTAVENVRRGNVDPTLSSAVLQLPEAT